MEGSDARRDHGAFLILPRPGADAVLRIRDLSLDRRAEVRMPGVVATLRSHRERLAPGVGSGEPTELAAISSGCARDEEGHCRLRPAVSRIDPTVRAARTSGRTRSTRRAGARPARWTGGSPPRRCARLRGRFVTGAALHHGEQREKAKPGRQKSGTHVGSFR